MGCEHKKHKYKKVVIEDSTLVKKMNNSISGLAGGKCGIAVKKRRCN